MKNKILHILMILIALQSSIAVADFYQPHHSESEHITTTVTETSFSDEELQTHQINLKNASNSCHHYCYCHTISFVNLNTLYPVVNATNNTQLFKDLSKNYKSRSITPDLRPPIA